MSEQAAEGSVLIDPRNGDAAFAALMGALVPAEGAAPAGTDAPSGGAAPGAGGDAAPPAGSPSGGAGTGAGAGDGAGAGKPAGDGAAAPDAGAAGAGADGAGGADAPATGGDAAPVAPPGDVAVADLAPRWGELSTGFESKLTESYQAEALEEVKTEYAKYFEILEQHPRLIVGQEVPDLAPGSEAMIRLKDSADAKEWQDALKSVLVDEVRGRASKLADDNADFLSTIHQSIELFQNNADLVPGTKEFDRDLADRFAAMVEPYELRNEGKLQGYAINVQPLITQLRTQIHAEREKAAAAPTPPAGTPAAASTPAAGAPAATPPTAADLPQAGISSKSGQGDQAEDFSTLFGTLGLPNLRI